MAMRPVGWLSAFLLVLLLAACGGTAKDNAPKKGPVDCIFNGPCTGK